ncbi:MAG: DUF6290 family protein [Candidatus Hodarchaeota archaeon]
MSLQKITRLTSLVQVRITPEEKELWKEKAMQNGVTLSQYIRRQVEQAIAQNLDERYNYMDNLLHHVRKLVDEFKVLFPSDTPGFSFE